LAELSVRESERIENVMIAATLGEWERFRQLTDEPFSSEAAMMEQFLDSSADIQSMNDRWDLEIHVATAPDGTRIIFLNIRSENPEDQPIALTMHSTSETADSRISIWTFYQTFDWS
jgi:hypothetical protein